MKTIKQPATPALQATRTALLGTTDVPTRKFAQLWHVGTMQVADKGCDGASYEGTGLSISTHPQDWGRIARLGNQTWSLRRRPNQFLNFHKLSKAQRAALQAWGISKGYLTLEKRWEMRYFDSDMDEECFSIFETEAQAQAEVPDWLDEDEDPPAKVSEVLMACPTAAMTARLQFKTDCSNALDITATFWVEDETELDGVWWNDRLAPESLSAPRGVIVCRALPLWTVTQDK